jgi:hypothetical protein
MKAAAAAEDKDEYGDEDGAGMTEKTDGRLPRTSQWIPAHHVPAATDDDDDEGPENASRQTQATEVENTSWVDKQVAEEEAHVATLAGRYYVGY